MKPPSSGKVAKIVKNYDAPLGDQRARETQGWPSLGFPQCPRRMTQFPSHLHLRTAPMAEQYIFQIEGLHKFYNKREVLKNIWLAFYPGAKIGVIGSNGAGKSTLLRV